ncbi:DNA helicase/exodeoxyribonuclease V gamma subunit [Barrientosiimonas humi]|uniref:RecBCD enzyme subunit RecC n=1 Tax=Barrientosiimonas humi TaxID=999931 RepID=A0A542XFV6_9MICO|nr:exodeoxyribonuclease V subunit gamma [Barrientosiimonas humi]TQL34685.1 DNA helicase/exodeoxyribonuclease V gamma subunit [Barrientosiimonas humi]CAG7574675.1 RecBCD enzyme subunit RecC [Barrientosiimonas humi]
MPLHLHRAARTDLLADELAGLLAVPPSDPFAQEVVVVPARGVERWVTQRLSHRLGTSGAGADGVCAGVRFLTPASLVTMLLGRDRDDPWLPDHLVWSVLATIDEHLDDEWARPLARHLGHGDDSVQGQLRRGRRYSVARRVAGLFHAYAQQRPALLTAWRDERDDDGGGGLLDDDLRWQPPLWRHVVARIGEPPPDERHRTTLERLRRGDDTLDLPDRLSLFGHTRIARTDAELLAALGARRDVHLWLPQPSPALWDTLKPLAASGPVRRRDDRSADEVDHLLLLSLGRDSRELRRTLGGLGAEEAAPGVDPGTPDTWLGWLQADLRANHEPLESDRAARQVADADRSIQVHACHGPARQVEVLREVLVGLLQDDATLEPRDVLVMCPDIETYAPLVQAAFGLHDLNLARPGEPSRSGHPGHDLRVRLADRALTSTNPLLDLAARLVALAGGRVTASQVLDLAALAPVRRRFELDDEDLATLAGWVEQAAVRWGIDERHREAYDLGWLRDNTWALGIDRLLLGVTRAGSAGHAVEGVLPVDDVSSTDIDLAGALAELLDRLTAVIDGLLAATGAQEWIDVLADGIRALADVPLADAWQMAQLDRELGAVVASADADTPLQLTDVRLMLDRSLGGRPTRSSFRTGSLTVCTMTPMRSVPHRVVCLLGLDDGVFPRTPTVDGDDVLARDPFTGERDQRSEDRQLLLDAVLAATDHLVVTYSGADEHTGGERPPAVPLGELVDAARRTATLPEGREVVVRHPLQAYDPRNLTAGSLDAATPFSFDPTALEGARAARSATDPPPLLLPDPLPAAPTGDVLLDDLIRFFDNPARALLRDRLDVLLAREEDDPDDAVPVEVAKGLDEWQVGERLLADALDGVAPQDVLEGERRRGLLPPGQLGEHALQAIVPTVAAVVERAGQLRQGEARSIDITVDLGGDRRLTGTVGGVYDSGQVSAGYSRIGAKPQLRAWITALALAAGAPHRDDGWCAHTVGKARRGGGAEVASYGPVDPEQARGWLRELVDVRDRGLREPVPFAPKTALAYADALLKSSRRSDRSATYAAQRDWEGGKFDGERDDPAVVRLRGPGSTIDDLTGPPLGDEAWSGSGTRLGQYALRVFGPMLTHGKR